MLWWTLRQLRSKDPWTRRCAVEKLAKRRDARAKDSLIASLIDPEISLAACLALNDIDPNWKRSEPARAAVSRYLAYLTDQEPRARSCAAQALGLVGDPRAMEPLLMALVDPDVGVEQAAVEALKSIDHGWRWSEAARAIIPKLSAGLEQKDRDARLRAVGALVRIVDPSIVAPLLGALNDSEPEVRVAIVRELAQLGKVRGKRLMQNTQVVELLLVALRDTCAAVREAAARQLGEIADKRALETLAVALSDRDVRVRLAVAGALHRMEWIPIHEEQWTLLVKQFARAVRGLDVEAPVCFHCEHTLGRSVGTLPPSAHLSKEPWEQIVRDYTMFDGTICHGCMTVLCDACRPKRLCPYEYSGLRVAAQARHLVELATRSKLEKLKKEAYASAMLDPMG